MIRAMVRTAMVALLLVACGGDDPMDVNGEGASGVGTRYMSTGGAVSVATDDTTYFSDGTTTTGSETFSTSASSSWIWDAEVLATDDVDSLVVHYEVVEGEIELQTFTGLWDTSETAAEDAWTEIEVVDSVVFSTGQGARVLLESP